MSALPAPLALDLRSRSLTRIADLAAAELEAVLDLAEELKRLHAAHEPRRPLEGRTLGLLFGKNSTRTRVSLEVAIAQLGGTAVQLPPSELQLARGESLADTARVLSRYLDAIAVRTGPQAELDQLAAAATIPVINALTDEEHPLQALADLLTIRERLGGLDGVRVAWVGDGSNVCVSLAAACALVGADFACASPAGYEPAGFEVVRDPHEAAPAHTCSSPTRGRAWARSPSGSSAPATSRPTPSTRPCSSTPTLERSCCTASRRTRARRSPQACCTAPAPPFGPRLKIACTRRRRCSRSSCADQARGRLSFWGA